MVPMKGPYQELKKLVERGGHPYDAEHEAILVNPLASGRLYTLPNHGLRMVSPSAAVKPLTLLPLQKVSQCE